ncbi:MULTISPECIES: AraC family transcriptional regulator [Lacticaseibacillus]|uniref:AraC family transcriptional regulator n=1 Tax=Lacticaseibacillus TaxID=2759736 RepID=UPI00063DA08D|nr:MULTISPECIES: AraC family transcriptional regulator [Lacticaseibacillus]KLI75027.1 hypothetical protein AAW28_10310 [Lacticaseibacillus casei]
MKTLDEQLRTIDPVEAKQRATGKNINDLSKDLIRAVSGSSMSNLMMPRAFFTADQDIVVRKHHRFSTMPEHTHDFVELNYVYSGICTQLINGKPVTLSAGTLIMLDKNITQSIEYMGENDILVNILLRDGNSLNSVLADISHSQNIVTKFMYNASKIDSIHSNFIIFNLTQNDYAKKLIECIILKGLNADITANEPLRMLYALLVPEMTSCIEAEVINFNQDSGDVILSILKYIEQHYQTVTLTQLAEQFGYNPNYIGNKLRLKTGESFLELVDDKRFAMAKTLLTETDDSIEKIANFLGYNSPTSFYHLFKRKIGVTPRKYRLKLSPQRHKP